MASGCTPRCVSKTARLAVIVPAFQEERHIASTLRGLPSWIDEIIVVDDASADQTSAQARAVGDPRVQVIRHPENRGVGAAIYTGYAAALARGAEVLIVMAGDDQMDPRDLPAILAPVLEQRADYVKGNRFLHEEAWRMPLHRRWGSRLLAAVTSRVAGQVVGDSQCGYTALSRRAALQLDFEHLWQSYGYPNELLIALCRKGARIVEVPVRPVYRDEASGLRPWHLLSILLLILSRSHTALRAKRLVLPAS